MSVKLIDLQKRTKTVQVEYQGDVIYVEYRVNVVTPAFVSSELSPVEQITQVVADWDVLDDMDQHIPPAEVADKLPVGFLSRVMEAIVADMRVGDAEKKG